MSNTDSNEATKGFLPSAVYDKLKWVAQIFLPALAVFYITISPFWGLPKQEEVAGTIMALDLLLGACLSLSKARYDASDAKYDGVMIVGETKNSLVLNDDVPLLEDKQDLLFKVEKPK